MRRLRIACGVAALAALLWTVPVTAQPESAWPTSWGAFAGGVVDWAVGLWRVVAGSETEPPSSETVESDNPEGIALDGFADSTTTDPCGKTQSFPGYDPDG